MAGFEKYEDCLGFKYRNPLEFCVGLRSSFGFSIKFQLAPSFTRPNSCTSNPGSPNCGIIIRTTLA
jgi:hypothetical protein